MIESRTAASPVVLDHMESLVAVFRAGGLSVDLTHHAMHALGTRMWGFTQEVFPTPATPAEPEAREAVLGRFAERYPAIVEMATTTGGCDDQVEFEFALDLLLDGIERLHHQRWSPTSRGDGHPSPAG